ncbi:winged helix-turn-helix domain-containing protein [Pseudomonas sp. CGJS7]|uniref:winged helix-turn-helix domain-containing protein n=1 Tax=Pseudomonas sp. CGJS7 TaxID=3109348 RepID=UPI00300847C5
MTTPWPAEAQYLQLTDVIVDLRFRRLQLDGRNVELPQRVFDLMLLFLSEPHRLHTRAALFERLWPGTVVEDTNLSQNVWLLRKALGAERKSWIRTIAKSGYVFEPPCTVGWLERTPAESEPGDAESGVDASQAVAEAIELEPTPSEQASACALSAAASELAPAPSAWRRESNLAADRPVASTWRPNPRQLRWAVTIGALLIAAIAALVLWRQTRQPAGRSVALVMMQDGAGSSSWPAKLLQQWLWWKLDSLPEVTLLSESDVASDRGAAPVDVVFLSSVRVGDSNELELHARLLKDGKEERLGGVADPAEMPALVDSLSGRIVADLLPERAAPWPKLEVGADTAERYEGFARALDRRDWMTASLLGKDIVERAPRFALARLQLADALNQLSQANAAIEHQRIAAQLLQDAPADAVAALAARQQAMRAEGTDRAVSFYSGLLDRYPDKADYRLKLAELLIQVGQYERALSYLDDAHGRSDGLGARIGKRLLRAQAFAGLGDPVRMRASAIQAQQLARDAGAGWESEQAQAWLLRGRAEHSQNPERRSASAFQQAATLYRRTGDATGELYADYLARMAIEPGVDVDAELAVLLARANAGGHRRLEVLILIANADHYSVAGDAAAYYSRLRQAAAIAVASGDPVLIGKVNMRLLNVEILAGRLDRAAEIARRQRPLDLRGNTRVFLDQNTAALALIEGDAEQALQIMAATERLLPPRTPGQRESEASAQIACVRADLLLPLGRLEQAREMLTRCRQGQRWALQFYAPSLESHIEWLAGDRRRSTVLLDQAAAAASTTTAPDRWLNAIEVARLATRLGDIARSERLYAEVLPQVRSAGYGFLVGLTLTGMAENAAARGDLDGGDKIAAQARRTLPDNAWIISSRLDLLAVFAARQRGDMAAANVLGARLHRRARELNDVVVELQLHQLLGPESLERGCGADEREALIARTGMRGARMDWLPSANAARADAGRRYGGAIGR